MKNCPQKLDPPRRDPGCRIVLLAALMSMNMGCPASADSLSKTLAFASFEFNDGVRWRKYQQASKRLSPVIRDTYLDHAERADDKIVVSEINLLRTKLNVKNKSAELRFRYIWHRVNRGLVRKSVVVEHWKQIKEEWFVVKILQASGREFPLFVDLTPEAQRKKKKAKLKKARPQPPEKVRQAAPPQRPLPRGPARP